MVVQPGLCLILSESPKTGFLLPWLIYLYGLIQDSNSWLATTQYGAITFALILQKFRLRLSYTCAHKSGAFALSFCVTLAPIYSQLFLGQLLVFEPLCKNIGLRGSVFGSLSFLNLKPSCKIPGFPRVLLKIIHIKNQKLKCKNVTVLLKE